jgi:hypothetical protein
VLLAAQQMAGMSGVEFLVAAHRLHPAAKRVLLVERGDYGAAHPAVRAITLGQIDYHLFIPWQPAERWLYPPLSDFLAAWSKTREPSFAAIRIVGRQWEPRSHQLRDMLTRIAMPYQFYPHDSRAGRAPSPSSSPTNTSPNSQREHPFNDTRSAGAPATTLFEVITGHPGYRDFNPALMKVRVIEKDDSGAEFVAGRRTKIGKRVRA